MKLKKANGNTIQLTFSSNEIVILHHLLSDLIAVIETHEPNLAQVTADPELPGLYLELETSAEAPTDSVMARLLPSVYADESLSTQFREMTKSQILLEKIADTKIVQDELNSALQESLQNSQTLLEATATIPHALIDAWVRTLNALRITMAARLEITSEADLERIRSQSKYTTSFEVADWLAGIIELLLQVEPLLDKS